MRKSSLILLLAMAFVFATVVSGFCVENEVGEPCKICDEKNGWTYGLEIDFQTCAKSQSVTVCPCPTFDYELGSDTTSGDVYGGYCDTQDVNGVLLKICDCEEAGSITTTKSYAIRVTIMEPASGVYFTDRNFWNTDMANDGHGCAADCGGAASSASSAQGDQVIWVSSHADPDVATDGTYCVDACETTPTDYALPYISATAGQTLYSPATDGDEDCCFTCGNTMVKSVMTDYCAFMKAQMPLLLIDIPEFVYDPNDINVALGTAVKVKVELVEQADETEICTSCQSICECIVKVGEFAECAPSDCTLCIPYLPAVDSGWWGGVALTNTASSAANVVITFYAAGASGSYTLSVPAKSVETVVLGDIIDDLGLATDANVYGNIVSSQATSAFVMMGVGLDAAQGYVAICGSCGCSGTSSSCSN